MRTATLLFVLFLLSPVLAEEAKKPADPVKSLPKALQPGATATWDGRGPTHTVDGTVTLRVAAGHTAGTVLLSLEYDTGDRGVLTMRDRLTAVLDARSKKILTFKFSVGGKKDEPYLKASRLFMETDPKKKPGPVHERYTWKKKGEPPRVKRTRPKLPDVWFPERLEPFLVPLLGATEKTSKSVTLVNELTGTVMKKPAVWRGLGEGAMKVGKADVPCRIFSRKRGDASNLLYLRASDSVVVKSSVPPIRLRPAGKETEDGGNGKKDKTK
ncbi:MAG: hypothetical protein ABFS86_06860 [Planctomycetota bacterium]